MSADEEVVTVSLHVTCRRRDVADVRQTLHEVGPDMDFEGVTWQEIGEETADAETSRVFRIYCEEVETDLAAFAAEAPQ